jgi:hypothetical protein
MIKTTTNLCVVAIFLSSWLSPVAQNQKTIMRKLTLVKEPVAVSFLLKGEPLKTSDAVDTVEGWRAQQFEADPGWLKNLTVKLKNTSGKTITYIVLNLYFPEAMKNGRIGDHQIFLGVDPDRKFPRPEFRLAPNESVEIPVAAQYQDIETLARTPGVNLPVENVSKLWVEFHAALFDDGTLFEAGVLYKRKP